MLQHTHRYVVELFKEDRSRLARQAVEIDWQPAVGWVQFSAIRQARLPPVLPAEGWVVRPVWHAKLGRPYVGGFRVEVFGPEGQAASRDIPTAYLSECAQRVAAGLVERGQLEAGEQFWYLVLAFAAAERGAGASAGAARFTVQEVAQPLALRSGTPAEFLRTSRPCGEAHVDDPPVFLRRPILDEILALTRHAGAEETGGVLIGHLHRGADDPEIATVVSAQISARHTRRELTKLTFTRETWADVQAAITLRDRGEIYLGWWHCHNFLKTVCQDCPKLRAGTCNVDNSCFMSREDRALHQAIFPRAYSIALVLSDSPAAGLSWRLFGWRYGLIAPRGFHILDEPSAESNAPLAVPAEQGETNAARTKP